MRGDDRLPDVHAPGDDDAFDRRLDGRIAQIDFRHRQCGLALFDGRLAHLDVGFGHQIIGLGKVVVGLGDGLLGQKKLGPVSILVPSGRVWR